MKLYLIERTDEIGYDEYDSIVVAASSEDQAMEHRPWVSSCPSTIKVIGTAARGISAGSILNSFNAG